MNERVYTPASVGVQTEVAARLMELRDEENRKFVAKLIPHLDPETILGVRSPQMKALAKELKGTPEAAAFLAALPHGYYEENNLHALFINGLRDYDACLAALDEFLPYVDNWATCDSLRPTPFKKHPGGLPEKIGVWMASEHAYTIRFGVEMLMTFYLDGEFRPEYLEKAAAIRSGEYYVNMMTAWYFATALAKQYDAALPFLQNRALDRWTHNKAIQKAIESYRITPEQKAYLRTLKIAK